ncbi:hypothetical protein N7539_005176 [Penicillium diatomitis]|uniref:Actin cortical patch SUR7/pH-response regulator PalI n=1 Tax=Penicillium diatomitis TaxID=2819901 RepID=A0A9X0BUH1_9EURO|nr:uncharacterized protein N7539_005176 [Penicillium diatomitis]KAJ5485188.1 hypothetical protein N7539_005176 [Penicillium diatomitis]
MSRVKGIASLILAFVAFVVILCCLFAGTTPRALDSVNLLRLYTPEGNSISSPHDFYSIHVMSYCQGIINAMPAGTTDPFGSLDIRSCSNRTVLFSFDPTIAWPRNLTHGAQLQWPRVISDDFRAFQMTSRAMAVIYSVGVGAIGAVLVVKILALSVPRLPLGVFDVGFMLLSTLCIGIASVIANVLAFELVQLINAHGDGSNVYAQYGGKFLGMTWASTALMVLGTWFSFSNAFSRGQEPAPASEEHALAPSKDEEEG